MPLILIADDHPLNRHFLATLLSYHHYRIREAADGVEALESAREQRPDVIIADLAMPRMDGFSFVTALRADPALASVPIIFYTASYREVESRAIARAAGVEHVITKPSDPEVILETVERALGRSLPTPKHHESNEQLRHYAERLQVTNIRMSALIELGFDLNAEHDADRLMRTACIAVRTVFGCDYAAIALASEGEQGTPWTDGDVDQEALMNARPFLSAFGRRIDDPSDSLLKDISSAMRNVRSVLLLPMTNGRGLYGTILLGKSAENGFSTDDERLGLAAAATVRAAHENLMLVRSQREHARMLSREQEDLANKIDERTRELRMANDVLREQMAERERTEGELRSSRERLRALSARVLSIQEEERTRIARELHDDLGQLITSIKIDVSRLMLSVSKRATPPATVMDGLLPLIDTTLDRIGEIVSELRPSRIGQIGLAAAVEKKLAEFQQRTEIECELSIRPAELNVREEIAVAVFRILEEALTNIARHSESTRLDVRLRLLEDELLLEARDNGRGIRDDERLSDRSYGLIGMKERAALFGGSLNITGIEGRGTIVVVRIPIDEHSADSG